MFSGIVEEMATLVALKNDKEKYKDKEICPYMPAVKQENIEYYYTIFLMDAYPVFSQLYINQENGFVSI